ncbi:MAG: hypothetical protein CL483_08205 [Acidobacteria bacterium]|mgnify:CR=1 FL=1|nr:hypothetical protein [Acidobacteriota bacterium]|tara:strand:+ start:3441 stop:3764 length:324 start_codon:yes stop_codon:yes gene_type:complete
MKRLGILLLLGTTMAGVLLYTGVLRDAEYRRLIAVGKDSLSKGESFLAIEAFSGAIALRGDAMLGYLKRGEAYYRRGELAAARSVVADALERYPQDQWLQTLSRRFD